MKTQFYLTERQKILVNSLSPADRDALADYIEYTSSMADPKVNPGGRLPEGNLANLFNKQNPRVQAALAALDDVISTPRYEPFQRKFTEAERLEELGLPIESGLTIKAASDAIDVGARLQARMGNDRSLPRKPPTLRDHVASAAAKEEPRAYTREYGDAVVADAGREANLPLRKHLEVASDVIGESRGHDFDEGLITAKGNDGDLRDTIETAFIEDWVDPGNAMSDRIPTVNAANATLPFIWSNGLKYDSAGRIVVSVSEPIANFSNGLPRSLAGDLCVTEI